MERKDTTGANGVAQSQTFVDIRPRLARTFSQQETLSNQDPSRPPIKRQARLLCFDDGIAAYIQLSPAMTPGR
jgi:hypothetical protein